jgi:hypothetical protein
MTRAAVLALLVACSSDPHVTPDAPTPLPFTYQLAVYAREPARTDPPVVYIDGVPTMSFSMTYASAAEADGTMHVVDLRYADQIIATWPVTVHETPFCASGPLAQRSESVAEYDSGDLRNGGLSELGTDSECHGDPSLLPNCACSGSERCGLRVVRDAPVFTHLRCTPIGPKLVGDACSFTSDADGAYDDCGSDLICYQGTCHALCRTTGCATTCVQPDGYPNEAAVCM